MIQSIEIAHIAAHVNEKTENIGARRLHTVLEKLLEDIPSKRRRRRTAISRSTKIM